MDLEQFIDKIRLANQQSVLAPAFAIVAPAGLHSSLMERLRQVLAVDMFDIHILQPELDERYIPVKAARLWLREMVSTPRGKTKIGFIRAADYLRTEAANALLKILEEPPVDTYLILLLAQDNLLPTIRSRLHLFTIAEESITEGIQVPDTVSAIIKLSNSWAQEKAVRQQLAGLLPVLRVKLRSGEVKAAYVQEVQRACKRQLSLGLDQKLLVESILMQYDV